MQQPRHTIPQKQVKQKIIWQNKIRQEITKIQLKQAPQILHTKDRTSQ
jgi:hypothetical protein